MDRCQILALRKRFWVGYSIRRPGGLGASVTTNMHFPPDHHDIYTPRNIVYSIAMATVFGPGIALPPGMPVNATLAIGPDQIRHKIVNNI